MEVFDALTTDRPYRSGLSAGAALGHLEAEVRRGWRDPAVVQAFRRVVEGSRR